MIVLCLYLAYGLDIKSGSADVVVSDKVQDYWSVHKMPNDFKGFIEGKEQKTREFRFIPTNEETDVWVEVGESSINTTAFPHLMNFEGFAEMAFTVIYTCGDKPADYITLNIQKKNQKGVEKEIKVKYLKVCQEIEEFSWNLAIINVLGALIVLTAVWLEYPISHLSASGSGSLETSKQSHLANFWFGYVQSMVMLVIVVVFLCTSAKSEVIRMMLNVLAGLALAYLLKHHLPMVPLKSSIVAVCSGTLLSILGVFFNSFFIQGLQFYSLSVFMLKTSKFFSLPLLSIASLMLFLFYLITLQSPYVPTLSSTIFLHASYTPYPSLLALPLFNSPHLFQVALSISELFFPGSILIKFRSSCTSIDSKYFYVALIAYTVSFTLETIIRVFTLTTVLFLPGPIVILTAVLYAVYRKEFWSIFLETQEQRLIISEVAMKSFS